MMAEYDLVIVGAGWHGLAMAKTFIEVHEKSNVLILDYASSLGGTWASERLYPGLKTNNIVGTYEFSDFPLVPEKYGIARGQHIPGQVVHAYLCDMCEAYGLAARIRFCTKAESATLLPDGRWEVAYITNLPTDGENSGNGTLDNNIAKDRCGKVTASKDFKKRAKELNGMKSVVVIGCNKSAWDVCYTSASHFNAKAHMIMRRSGGGPSWCWPTRMKGFLSSISRVSATRMFTWMDPNPYGRCAVPLRAFFTRNRLGRRISDMFWRHLGRKIEKYNAYGDGTGIADLKPWTSAFWMGNSLSIHNYETSWFDLVRRGQIKAHAAEVVSLSEDAVYLSDGTSLKADAVICCTGWKARPRLEFFPKELFNRVGMPGFDDSMEEMELEAHADVLRHAPVLGEKIIKHLPSHLRPEVKRNNNLGSVAGATMSLQKPSPYRLHRFVLPVDAELIRLKNVAIIGAHITLHTAIVSQAQALWITALFNGEIPHLSHDSDVSQGIAEIKRQMFFHTEYQKLRRPQETGGTGSRCPDLVFDSIPYVDMLLSDLDLPYYRKSSWYQEIATPYNVADYKGLVQEWVRKPKLERHSHSAAMKNAVHQVKV